MANMKHFAEFNGQAVLLSSVWHDGSVSASARHFSGLTPDGARVQCSRVIEFKSNPSLHKCDDRCLTAKGFKCECSCGGKNHGRGH